LKAAVTGRCVFSPGQHRPQGNGLKQEAATQLARKKPWATKNPQSYMLCGFLGNAGKTLER
jgi:hypothetical protein